MSCVLGWAGEGFTVDDAPEAREGFVLDLGQAAVASEDGFERY